MKTITFEQRDISTLADWQGAFAQVWLFHVSLKRMAIRLSIADREEVLYLTAVTCDRISSPFSWDGARITLDCEETPDGCVTKLMDPGVNMELRCGGVSLWAGPSDRKSVV